MRRSLLVPIFVPFALAALSACPGTIKLEEVEGFGSMNSAVWLAIDEDDGDVTHQILLSDKGGLCTDLQEILPEVNTLWADWTAKLLSAQFAEACSEGDELYEDSATLLEPIFGAGAEFMYLSLWDDNENLVEPDDGTWDSAADSNAKGLWFRISRYDQNPYQVGADEWTDNDCRTDADDVEAAVDTWEIDEATVEITMNNKGDVARGDLTGDLDDEDGRNAGDIDARFSASRCDVQIDEDEFFFPIY